jgi:hypothetical protein
MVWKDPSVPRIAQQRVRVSPSSGEGVFGDPTRRMIFPERSRFMIGVTALHE